jgi:hypothetical protein
MTSAVKFSDLSGGVGFRSDQPRKREDAANSTKFNRPYDEKGEIMV